MTSGQQYLNVAFINLKLIAMGTTLSAVMGCVTTLWSVKLCWVIQQKISTTSLQFIDTVLVF